MNTSPILSEIGDKAVDEGNLLTFTAVATDSDIPVNVLTFSLIAAPSGAVIDPVTGVFTWIPGEEQGPDSYPVTIRVTDNGGTSATVNQVVDVANADPAVSITDTVWLRAFGT